jgi:hypothetical protein
LGRHFLQLPPFAKRLDLSSPKVGMEACPPLVGGFSCVGATNIQVMSVYESINFGLLPSINQMPFS